MAHDIAGARLMLRVGPDANEFVLSRPHAREMGFTGRAMKGMVDVDAEGIATEEALKDSPETRAS